MFNKNYDITAGGVKLRRWSEDNLSWSRLALSISNLLNPLYRESLRGASERSSSSVISLRKHQPNRRDRELVSDMDRRHHQANAQRYKFLHWQPGCGRCHYRAFCHSLPVPGGRPTAMGFAGIYVPFLPFHPNTQSQRVDFHSYGDCYWQAQGNFKSPASSIIQTCLKNCNRRYMDGGTVSGKSNELWTSSEGSCRWNLFVKWVWPRYASRNLENNQEKSDSGILWNMRQKWLMHSREIWWKEFHYANAFIVSLGTLRLECPKHLFEM